MLKDNFNRALTYLRLSVTDRCNLRCSYCMPATGIVHKRKEDILSWEEMERLVHISASLGITKVRITGGEPFIRKGILPFIKRIGGIKGVEEIHVTTNGLFLAPLVPELKTMNIAGINMSLDTLKRERFLTLTRRDAFTSVMDTLHEIIHHSIPLKINTVVIDGVNDDEIISIAGLTKELPVEIRFLEEMPFKGRGGFIRSRWDSQRILRTLKEHYPGMVGIERRPSTASLFSVPGHKGRIGIIAGYSRKFCHACNKIRVTPDGVLKTCLYDQGVLDLKKMLRHGSTDTEIREAVTFHVGQRNPDGFTAVTRRREQVTESMASIGG